MWESTGRRGEAEDSENEVVNSRGGGLTQLLDMQKPAGEVSHSMDANLMLKLLQLLQPQGAAGKLETQFEGGGGGSFNLKQVCVTSPSLHVCIVYLEALKTNKP